MSSAVADREVDARPEPTGGDGASGSSAPPPAPVAPARRGRGRTIGIQIVTALLLLVLLLLGFGAYLFGLSNLSEQRAQNTLRKTFSHQLAQAVAPVGPATAGAPVAVLDIPRIGLRDAVVVEGTAARDLTNGPGHAAASPLPGQPGTSVVFGRRSTFGAPFAHLLRLDRGDRVRVTTGQGVATYQVSSFGDKADPAPANSTNRLLLVTADSGAWPHNYVTVSADLVSTVQAGSGQSGALTAEQLPLARDPGASLLPTLLWSQALVLTVILGVVAFVRWKPVAAYLCVAPVALVVLWNLYENVACLAPNLY